MPGRTVRDRRIRDARESKAGNLDSAKKLVDGNALSELAHD
jgi:hypothetical protein